MNIVIQTFDQLPCIYMKKIDENVILTLTKMNDEVMVLHFTDENENKITIPSGISITYDIIHNNKRHQIFMITNANSQLYCILYTTDTYEISYNESIVIKLAATPSDAPPPPPISLSHAHTIFETIE